jgi:hypothetical protein
MLCSFSRIINFLINLFTVLHVYQKDADERLTLSSAIAKPRYSVLKIEGKRKSVITDKG